MKKPIYEPSAGALAAFLNSTPQAIPNDLFTFKLKSGAVLRYCSLDRGLTYSGKTFLAGPVISRSRVRQTVGIEVDKLTVRLSADDTVTVGGVPIIKAIASGTFANAQVWLDRAYLDDSLTLRGVLPVFAGTIGQVKTGLNRAILEVRSLAALFDVMVPGEVYQPGCRNTLFDTSCGVAKASFKYTRAATGASNPGRTTFAVTFVAPASQSGWLDLGTVVGATGANAGIARTIKKHYGSTGLGPYNQVTVVSPWPYPVAIGDTFDFYAGCDKSMASCNVKFTNLANFRGEPFIPAPETVT